MEVAGPLGTPLGLAQRRPWDSPGKNTGVGCHFLLHPNTQCLPRASPPGVPWSHGRGLLPPSPPVSPQGRGGLPSPVLQNPGHKLPPALALCAHMLPHSKKSEMLGFHPGFSLSLLTAGDESRKGKRNEGLHQANKLALIWSLYRPNSAWPENPFKISFHCSIQNCCEVS